MKKSLLILLTVLAVASLLSAQEWKGQGRLPGIVVDKDDKPIEGVTVKLFMPQYNGGFSVTTDREGKWVGAWMRSGSWNIDFEKLGYMPLRKTYYMNQFERQREMKVVMEKVEGLVVTEDMKKELTKANDLYDKKDYAGAIAAYKDMLTKFPDAYIIWRNIGNCYFVQEKYGEAEAAYKEILAKDPNNVDALISIGNCYANQGDTDKALEWYGKVSLDKINDANSLYAIGLAYFKASKLDDAVACFKKAVSLDEQNADALYQLGLTYTALQNKPEAIAVFEQYLKLDPDSERADQVKGFLDYLKK
jgi:tetratricopeptide (TPR) repeat protein